MGILVAGGVVAWVLGSGWIWPDAISPPQAPPSKNDGPNRPSPDFAALIDAIITQGQANREEEKEKTAERGFENWLNDYPPDRDCRIVAQSGHRNARKSIPKSIVKLRQPLINPLPSSPLNADACSLWQTALIATGTTIETQNFIMKNWDASALVTGVLAECEVLRIFSNICSDDDALFSPAMSVIVGGSPLDPGKECALTSQMSDDDLSELAGRTELILFKGYVTYRDVFGKKWKKRFGQ